MLKAVVVHTLCAFALGAAAERAGAAPAAQAGKAARPAATPVHLDLPCPALQGPVGLEVDVKGEHAILRVEYPKAFETYRGRGDGFLDTRIFFDADNDARSGLEEWDAESLKLKGVDYSVELRELPAEEGQANAVNGQVLDTSVFKHDGSVSSATGSFTAEFEGNVATFKVDLYELHARPGSTVKALFTVGTCGPVAHTFRLGAAGRTTSAARTARRAAPAVAAAATPLHLDLPCPALEGSVGLDLDVKGDRAVLRVAYPRPFESYRGRDGLVDTFIYFDSDNDARSGLEEWDAESLKLKGVDYSVEVREHPAGEGEAGAVNGFILNSRVFKHDGTMANATGRFDSEYDGNRATFTVDLAELHASRGSVVKTLFMVGQCGPVTQTVRLGTAAGKR